MSAVISVDVGVGVDVMIDEAIYRDEGEDLVSI